MLREPVPEDALSVREPRSVPHTHLGPSRARHRQQEASSASLECQSRHSQFRLSCMKMTARESAQLICLPGKQTPIGWMGSTQIQSSTLSLHVITFVSMLQTGSRSAGNGVWRQRWHDDGFEETSRSKSSQWRSMNIVQAQPTGLSSGDGSCEPDL